MRFAAIAIIAAFSLSAMGASAATQCKDAKTGKFIKCPPPAAAPAKPVQCKDAKGKFMKCAPAAPAKPVRCKDAKGKFAKCDAPGAKPTA